MEAMARAGWAARAVLYLVTAVLATRVAAGADGSSAGSSGTGGEEASQTGALREIAQQPFGMVLLLILAGGLVAFAVWRLVTAWRDPDGDGAGKRLGYAGSGVVYGGLGLLAGSIVLHGDAGGSGGDQQAQGLTARVLAWPLGPWLVAAVGLVILGVGAYLVWRGLTQDFMEDLHLGGLPSRGQDAVGLIGEVGECARGAVFGLVGWFVVKAALEFDPDEARGLDGALRELAETAWGTVLLWAVAVGLLVYAVFCAIRARWGDTT